MPFNNNLSHFNDSNPGFLKGILNVVRNLFFIENEEDNSIGLLKYQEDRTQKLKKTPAEAVHSIPRYGNYNHDEMTQTAGKAHLSSFIEKIR